MQFLITNKNIRLRFALAKKDVEEQRQAAKLYRERPPRPFGLPQLGAMFDVGSRCAYTWVTKVKGLQHLPAGKARRAAVEAWLNDGRLERWIKEGAR